MLPHHMSPIHPWDAEEKISGCRSVPARLASAYANVAALCASLYSFQNAALPACSLTICCDVARTLGACSVPVRVAVVAPVEAPTAEPAVEAAAACLFAGVFG